MVGPDQLQSIAEFVRGFLYESFETSDQEWLADFPRAADHRWQHTLNVLANAEKILQGEGVQDDRADVVRVAVLLHDVSMFTCDHSVHGQVSAEIAKKYLIEQGYEMPFVQRVSRDITEHGTGLGDLLPEEQGELFSWEGKVVPEVDILDKLGASAITSALLFLGKANRLNFEARRELRSSGTYERAEFFKDFIWTDTGTRMAERRFAFFHDYLHRLEEELVEAEMPVWGSNMDSAGGR